MEDQSKDVGTLEGLHNISSEDFANYLFSDNVTKDATTVTDTSKKEPESSVAATAKAPNVEKKDDTSVAENKDTTGKDVDEKKPELKTGSDKKDDKKTVDSASGEKVDKKDDKPVDKKEESVDDSKKDDTEVELEFKLPEEEKAELEGGDGWKELAKNQGFDVSEDTFEAYQKGVEEFYRKKYEPNLGKFDPEAQRLIEFLDSGGKLENFIAPLKPIQELKSLSDAELVSRDLELRKWPADKIEKQIALLVEQDKLEVSAFALREKLDAIEEQIKEDTINKQLAAAKRTDTYKQLSKAEELSTFKKTLSNVKDFMDIPIKDKHKDYLIKQWESGKYDTILKDPSMQAQLILWHEFGDKGLQMIKEKFNKQVQLERKKDRHAIPPETGSGSGQTKGTSKTDVEAEGNWDALNGFSDIVFGDKKS